MTTTMLDTTHEVRFTAPHIPHPAEGHPHPEPNQVRGAVVLGGTMNCKHCHIRPIGQRRGGLCCACYSYRSRNGQLPPADVIAKRNDLDIERERNRNRRTVNLPFVGGPIRK